MPLVPDHMTRSLLTIPSDATIGEAAVKMAERAAAVGVDAPHEFPLE